MENPLKQQENRNPSQLQSPTSYSSSSSNGVHRSLPRSDINPYPTTFVQADTSSFKQVVQMLTGSSDTARQAAAASKPPPPDSSLPPIRPGPKKPQSGGGFRLYERRNSVKSLEICPLIPGFAPNPGFSPRKPEVLSPSMLDFPSLALSPVTPLIPDPFNRPAAANLDSEAEERAIAEKGFYLHPSPAATPRESEPQLLQLFPASSPSGFEM